MKHSFFITFLFWSMACSIQQPKTSSNMYINSSNKSLALDFYQRIIGQRDAEYAKQIIKENYIQHNPQVPTGLSGILQTLEFLKQMPQPENPPKPFMRLLADQYFAIVHMEVEVMGQKKAVIDIFRIEDGQLAEHWDAIQDIPENTANGNPTVQGTLEVVDMKSTNKNKKMLQKYSKDVLLERKFEFLDRYVSSDLIQHHPEIQNGGSALIDYYQKVEFQAVHRILGEGNFVCIQSSGLIEDIPHVIYDLFRLEYGKIVEQWNVSQEIPDVMAHENGMI